MLPPLFLNSVPKSGTHLMQQILLGIPGVTIHPGLEFYEGLRKDDRANYAKLSRLRPDEFVAGHIFYSPEWQNMLGSLGIKQIFMMRDLRDIVVSYVYFIVYKFPYHPLVNYLRHDLHTQKDRYLALINGVQTANHRYPSIIEWFDPFIGWAGAPNTLVITFEQLMSTPQARRLALASIVNHWTSGHASAAMRENWMLAMEKNINPANSITFRSGKIGSWRAEFDPEVRAAFKRLAGHRLIQFGYEKDDNW